MERTLLAVWRRVVAEGAGPELTLPEAAVLLGTSVESVRRRIKTGQIRAFHDERGRLRIVASVTPPAGLAELGAVNDRAEVAGLWLELKTAQRELDRRLSEADELRRRLSRSQLRAQDTQEELHRSRDETRELQEELETAHHALENTQRELASMWRAMSNRNGRQQSRPRFGLTDGNEAFDLRSGASDLAHERSRIQSQIARVRDLSRRRRWPWPQAS